MIRMTAVIIVLALSGLMIRPIAASPVNAAAKLALDRVIPEVKFTNVPLRDCIDFLRDISGANIHVNWKALEAGGITPDTMINSRLRNVTLRKVLDLIVTDAGVGNKLAFYVDDGVIEITTLAMADSIMITKVYPVEDLIMEIPDFDSSTSFNLADAGRSGRGASSPGGLGFGQGAGSGGGQSASPSKSKQQRGEDLVLLVTQTVRTEIWQQNGGPAGIRYYNGTLIVTAPRSVHEMVGGPVD